MYLKQTQTNVSLFFLNNFFFPYRYSLFPKYSFHRVTQQAISIKCISVFLAPSYSATNLSSRSHHMRSILQFLTDVIFNKIYKKTLIGDKTFDKYNLQKKKKKRRKFQRSFQQAWSSVKFPVNVISRCLNTSSQQTVYRYLRWFSGFARKNSSCRESKNTFWQCVHLATPHFLYSHRYRRRSRRSRAQKAKWRRCVAGRAALPEPYSPPST